MQNIHRVLSRLSSSALGIGTSAERFVTGERRPAFGNLSGFATAYQLRAQVFSAKAGGGDGNAGKDDWESGMGGSFGGNGNDLGWDSVSSWSTGLTKDHFDGELEGQKTGSSSTVGGGLDASQTALVSSLQEIDDKIRELDDENKKSRVFVDGWGERLREISVLLKQVREPGARGSYLKDSEKAEMYRLHKENPEVYTVERLAKDYRIMRQRVHAILWLKQLEEEEEKKRGHPLDDSVELLLDTCPE